MRAARLFAHPRPGKTAVNNVFLFWGVQAPVELYGEENRLIYSEFHGGSRRNAFPTVTRLTTAGAQILRNYDCDPIFLRSDHLT